MGCTKAMKRDAIPRQTWVMLDVACSAVGVGHKREDQQLGAVLYIPSSRRVTIGDRDV